MGLCIICAEEGSDKVEKDDNFVTMMDLYWKSLGIDVKPDANKTLELCLQCFDSVLQFYQVNDILVYFEARLKQLGRAIHSTNLQGIKKCEEKQLTLNKIQQDILEKLGTSLKVTPEIEKAEKLLESYKVTLDFEDPNQPSINATAKSRKTKGKNSKDDPRKKDAESTESSREGSKSPAKKQNGRRSDRDKGRRSKRRGSRNNKRRRIGSSEVEEMNSETDDDDDDEIPEEENSEDSDETSTSTSNDDDEVASDDSDELLSEPRITRRSSKTIRNDNKPDRVDSAASWTTATECKLCLDTFPSFTAYQRHYKSHKVSEEDRLYECRKCNQTFNRQSKLVDHKKLCKISEEEIVID